MLAGLLHYLLGEEQGIVVTVGAGAATDDNELVGQGFEDGCLSVHVIEHVVPESQHLDAPKPEHTVGHLANNAHRPIAVAVWTVENGQWLRLTLLAEILHHQREALLRHYFYLIILFHFLIVLLMNKYRFRIL